jgi:hypothetical protein
MEVRSCVLITLKTKAQKTISILTANSTSQDMITVLSDLPTIKLKPFAIRLPTRALLVEFPEQSPRTAALSSVNPL